MGTNIEYSSASHSCADMHAKVVKQVIEDMLRACVLTYNSNWDKGLPYAEFFYNNTYQSNLDMSPLEAFYGRKCRTPLMWSEVGERSIFGKKKIKEAKVNVAKVAESLKVTMSRQKSYANNRRRDLCFHVEDLV
jgi:hypothetical protein